MKYLYFIILFIPIVADASIASFGPYRAEVVKVKDGDTILIDVALWPNLTKRVALRLYGVNTPEKRGKGITQCEKTAAKKATSFTKEFLKNTQFVIVREVSLGKYAGRALGRVSKGKQDLGDALLTAGHAKRYFGGKREPWCE